jgi:hypothetical protein
MVTLVYFKNNDLEKNSARVVGRRGSSVIASRRREVAGGAAVDQADLLATTW